MMVYDLLCSHGHRFEEWFSSSADYEAKAAAGHLACPECGDAEVIKALMAPKLNSGAAAPAPATACGAPACASGMCQFGDLD